MARLIAFHSATRKLSCTKTSLKWTGSQSSLKTQNSSSTTPSATMKATKSFTTVRLSQFSTTFLTLAQSLSSHMDRLAQAKPSRCKACSSWRSLTCLTAAFTTGRMHRETSQLLFQCMKSMGAKSMIY